jgi:hypothetical protein
MRALMIREDVPPGKLRRLAKTEGDPRVARRLLAIAAALDGMSREAAARIVGMDRQTLRDWVIRYNRGGPAGLTDHWGDVVASDEGDYQRLFLRVSMKEGAGRCDLTN